MVLIMHMLQVSQSVFLTHACIGQLYGCKSFKNKNQGDKWLNIAGQHVELFFVGNGKITQILKAKHPANFFYR